MNLNKLNIDKTWSLFLDRDGVINKKLPNDYVKSISEFEFEEGAVEAIQYFSKLFGRIFVVTNQQGIGKGIMTKEQLEQVHQYMQNEVILAGGNFDKIYYCPHLAEEKSSCRKPNTGMAEQARSEFSEVDFKKSIMIGDSISDMQMGKRAGMFTVFINNEKRFMKEADLICGSLREFESLVKNSF